MVGFGTLEIVEIIQIGTILYFLALGASFLISITFTEFDKTLDKIESENWRTWWKFVEVYIQLLVTAIAYFYIEKVIYMFPSLSNKLNKNYPSYKSTNYVIHIVLIILLIEMNESLVDGLHFISKKLNITRH